jgi:predicted nucleotidyltransferase
MNRYKKTILKVITGSVLWGTNNENSDKDFKEVVVSSLSDVLSPFVQHDKIIQDIDGDLDITQYEISHLARLAIKGNPTIMEALYSPHIEFCDNDGKTLRQNRAYLLDSRAMYFAAQGMAKAQLNRVERKRQESQGDKFYIEKQIGKLYSSTILSCSLTEYLLDTKGEVETNRSNFLSEDMKVDRELHLTLKDGFNLKEGKKLADNSLKTLEAMYEKIEPFTADIEMATTMVQSMYLNQLNKRSSLNLL